MVGTVISIINSLNIIFGVRVLHDRKQTPSHSLNSQDWKSSVNIQPHLGLSYFKGVFMNLEAIRFPKAITVMYFIYII